MKHPPRNIDQSCFDWQKIILQKTDMPSNAKYLALYMASYMNMNRDVAWPSQKTIERETGLAHATILKWLDFLVEEGWLAKQSGSRIESNRYWISFPNEVGQSLTYVNQREEVGQPLTSNNNTITNTIIRDKKFKPPTVQEVEEYSSTIDAERFCDFYESKGWLIGKNKMKCWKSAARNWERNSKKSDKTVTTTRATSIEQDLTDKSWAGL
jgi:hypothetical protein|tara:strand:- start:525 stop:1157 length:633 start_codon:yes stop_codon:yes gene_type:complete